MAHPLLIFLFMALLVLAPVQSAWSQEQQEPVQETTVNDDTQNAASIATSEEEEKREGPKLINRDDMDKVIDQVNNNSYSPLISRLVNYTTSAAIIKTSCGFGSNKLSPEFIRKQSVIDRIAINQIRALGYEDKVAFRYLQNKKQLISDILYSRRSHNPLFCNGDYALLMASFYKQFSNDTQNAIMEVYNEIFEDMPTEQEQEAERILGLIEEIKD